MIFCSLHLPDQIHKILTRKFAWLGELLGEIYIEYACAAPYDWTLGNKLQGNVNRNSNIFIYENAHENVVCEMASILSRPRCVNTLFSVVKCKRADPAMHRSCISRLICIEPPVCYLSAIEHNVILCIHHYCACFSFSGGLHASGQIWP